MNRFAPSWLPRQQRRRIDRELDKDTPNNNCYDFGDCLGLIV